MTPEDLLKQERDARITELEARLRRRTPLGVSPAIALVAILAAGYLASLEVSDLQYFFSDRAPLLLGTEGEYRFDLLESNRYAQVHGVPTLRGMYSREKDKVFVVVGMRDTPLLIRRESLETEQWGAGPPPQPDQRPFAIRGRLLSEKDAGRYGEAFKTLRASGQVHERDGQLWMLIEGQRPADQIRSVVFSSGLFLFVLFNAWLLIARRRRSARFSE